MSEMEYTYYGFRNCIGGFFEIATTDARKLLPPHLEPLEKLHTRSVLAITAFEFTESSVGAYNEIVLAVVVPPRVEPGKPLPKAAFFPFMVATSTRASREHAIERWHLPHYMKDLGIEFSESDGTMELSVSEQGTPVLDLLVTEHTSVASRHQYCAFTVDGDTRYKVNIYMEAPHSEHEEERGSLTLHEHPLTEGLSINDVNSYPFREEWYRAGAQTFEMLELI